jgi:hypothetical protein
VLPKKKKEEEEEEQKKVSWCQWFTPAILATWETDIRRIKVQGQSRKIV